MYVVRVCGLCMWFPPVNVLVCVLVRVFCVCLVNVFFVVNAFYVLRLCSCSVNTFVLLSCAFVNVLVFVFVPVYICEYVNVHSACMCI